MRGPLSSWRPKTSHPRAYRASNTATPDLNPRRSETNHRNMSKRKRDWSDPAGADHGRGLTMPNTSPTQSNQQEFVRPQLPHARSNSLGITRHPGGGYAVGSVVSNNAQDAHGSYQTVPTLASSAKSDNVSWHPPPVQAVSANVADAVPATTRKSTACAACRKQKVWEPEA